MGRMNQQVDAANLLRRFVIITGKGGVGKSAMAATLGLLSAQRGDKTLICELNAHERTPSLLGHKESGPKVTRLEENLWSVNINPQAAMQEYGLLKLKYKSVARLVFDNPMVGALIKFLPGVNDLLMLGKAFNHERETDDTGKPVWDRVIVDAPASGHSLTFLTLPRVIMEAVPSGNMHRESADMWRLLSDPERSAIHIVSLPEELPVTETIELYDRLVNVHSLPVASIIINQMPERAVPPELEMPFRAWKTPPDDPGVNALWLAGKHRQREYHSAVSLTEQLKPLDCETVFLPRFASVDFGRSTIEDLATAIRGQLNDG